MDWSRTLRFDAPPDDSLERRIREALEHDGVLLQISGSRELRRTYVLVEGPEGVDPAELQPLMPDARWFPAAIVALAIEPAPKDALPPLAHALGGPGAPAGMISCEVSMDRLVVEFRPDITSARTIAASIDVELRRFSGSRVTELLAPLPVHQWSAIAAEGLACLEMTEDRILESLLSSAHVE